MHTYSHTKQGGRKMPNSNMTNVTVRMDKNIKQTAEVLFKSMGLNMTTAINLFAVAVVQQQKIPFEILADPFYSAPNQARLKKSILRLNAGEGLIEKTLEELKSMENA